MRDDKMATSVFFLSDFLFKFHRRALSWANLERVDELAISTGHPTCARSRRR